MANEQGKQPDVDDIYRRILTALDGLTPFWQYALAAGVLGYIASRVEAQLHPRLNGAKVIDDLAALAKRGRPETQMEHLRRLFQEDDIRKAMAATDPEEAARMIEQRKAEEEEPDL